MATSHDITSIYRMINRSDVDCEIPMPNTSDINIAVRLIQSQIPSMPQDKLHFEFDKVPFSVELTTGSTEISGANSTFDLSEGCTLFEFFRSKQKVLAFFSALCLTHIDAIKEKQAFMQFCLYQCFDIYKDFILDFCNHAKSVTKWQASDTECLELVLACYIGYLTGEVSLNVDFDVDTVVDGLDADYFVTNFNLKGNELQSIKVKLKDDTKSFFDSEKVLDRDEALSILSYINNIIASVHRCGDTKAAKLILDYREKIVHVLQNCFPSKYFCNETDAFRSGCSCLASDIK